MARKKAKPKKPERKLLVAAISDELFSRFEAAIDKATNSAGALAGVRPTRAAIMRALLLEWIERIEADDE